MIVTTLFPEMARWLVADGRNLVVMPVPRKAETGPEELFDAAGHLALGPCAVVTSPRAIVRMLGVQPDAKGWPRALLGDHHGHHVSHVIDLGGTYIPGQGTPVAVLLARKGPLPPTVRVVADRRGEHAQPPTPAEGLAWQAVRKHWDDPGVVTTWTRTIDVNRGAVARVIALLSREVTP